MSMEKEVSIHQWLNQVLANGAHGFSKDVLQSELSQLSDTAIKRALNRLSRSGRIVSLYKGYYLIIPPQYSAQGMLPPPLYLDAFMGHLGRWYYVGLLNAAGFHGAAHQQPQEYFVMTGFPPMRPTQKNGLKINYISIKRVPDCLIEQRKTEAGYLNISNAALSACDLIQFEKRVGGLNRAATVLNELTEAIDPTDFSMELIGHVHVTVLQRLGYLMQEVCFQPRLADALFNLMLRAHLNFYRIPLNPSGSTKGFSSGNKWGVIVNAEVEIDE